MIIERTSAHSQDREPLLEIFLSFLRFRKIIRLIPENSIVLDLGCGYHGRLLSKIKNKISSGLGIDLSVDPIFSNEKIKLLSRDLNESLPVTDNEFDVVVSLANLEHLEDPRGMIQEIYRSLKPGGFLLLTTPSIYGKPVLELLAFLGLISKQEIRDHKNYFNKKILKDYCENIGFSSCKHKYFQAGMNNFLIAIK